MGESAMKGKLRESESFARVPAQPLRFIEPEASCSAWDRPSLLLQIIIARRHGSEENTKGNSTKGNSDEDSRIREFGKWRSIAVKTRNFTFMVSRLVWSRMVWYILILDTNIFTPKI